MPRNLKVLVVDDDLTYLHAAEDLLSDAGFEVHVCDLPIDAWMLLKSTRPDCLVLDLNMPFLNGRKFLPVAHLEFPGMAVVICTGNEVGDEDFFKQNGVQYILKKPVSSRTLIQTVEDAVEQAA